jgi:His-Xaa-Ser system protein HxsD
VSSANTDDAEGHPSAVVTFPAGLYSLDAIKRAAYRLSDVAVVDISPQGAEVKCSLGLLRVSSPQEAQRVLDAFKLEVLDQDLRTSIAAETAPIRNAILALVFSKTGLQSD